MTDIIKSALGLLFDKARDVAASKLFEGDVTDETLRGVFVSEIYEINKKLDGLAGQYLLSSHSFLSEGLTRLDTAVQKKSTNSNTPTTLQNLQAFSTGASPIQQRLRRELKVVSQHRFVNAKESFKESRKQATLAFNNVSLSIDHRITASKYRIVSRMLESFLEDPEAGARDCLLYLEELHSLPAIREIFSVYFWRSGGVKSFFKSFLNKEERVQKVKTIRSINTVVRDFIANFTTEKFCEDMHWPTIQLRNEEKYEIYDTIGLPAHLIMARYSSPPSKTPFPDRPLGLNLTDSKTRHLEEFTNTGYYSPLRKMPFPDRPLGLNLTEGKTRHLGEFTNTGYYSPLSEIPFPDRPFGLNLTEGETRHLEEFKDTGYYSPLSKILFAPFRVNLAESIYRLLNG